MGKARVTALVELTTLYDVVAGRGGRPEIGRNRAPEIMELYQQLASLLSGNLTGENIRDGSLTRSVLGADVLIPRMAQGQYTGDGSANRVITTQDANGPFTPTEVKVLATTDINEFFSRDDGTSVFAWYRLASGLAGGATTDWQGIVLNGFKTGSAAGSLSNKNGQVYSWVAWRRG